MKRLKDKDRVMINAKNWLVKYIDILVSTHLESLRLRSGLLDLFFGEDLLLGEGELFLFGDADLFGEADLFGDLDLLSEPARFLGEPDSALRDLRESAPLVSPPLCAELSSISDFVGDCDGL